MPQGKWKIAKLLDEFAKELLSRKRINILNSDNSNRDQPVFSGSTLCIYKPKMGNQEQVRFPVLIVKKTTTQATNVQLLLMSKLENKSLLTKLDVLIVYV